MKKFWLALILLVILVAISPFVFRVPKTAQVNIDGRTFNVEVADSDTERAKGLSGRESLDANAGMLFVFSSADIQTFWMKDMKIPLDIIFIDNNKIVEIATLDIPNGGNIPSYTPKEKAQYVLELNANSGFKIGDDVSINY